MPSTSRRKRPPLDRRSAVAVAARRLADALAGRRAGPARGDAFDMEKNEGEHVAVALSRRARGRSAKAQAAQAHRRRQGQRARVVAGRPAHRLHREAPGRHRAAGLPDRARRRRGATRHHARDRRVGAQVVPRRQAHRVRLLGLAGSCAPMRAGEAHEGAQGRRRSRRTSPSAGEYRYWDHWLADGREPHLFVVRRRQRRVPRRARRAPGCALRPWDPTARSTTSRPTAARSRSRSTRATSRGMTHARRPRRPRPARRGAWQNLTADSGMSDEHPRYSPDGTPHRLPRLRHAAGVQRPGPPAAARSRARGAWTRLAPALRPRDDARLQWSRDGSALLFLCEDRGRIGVYRLDTGRRRRRRRWSRGGTIGGFARSRDGARAGLRSLVDDAPAPQLFAAPRRRQRRACASSA